MENLSAGELCQKMKVLDGERVKLWLHFPLSEKPHSVQLNSILARDGFVKGSQLIINLARADEVLRVISDHQNRVAASKQAVGVVNLPGNKFIVS